MLLKKHTGFKVRFLCILFLFINCICSAAPVFKFISEDDNYAVATTLPQAPNSIETEEESHGAALALVIQPARLLLQKKKDNCINQTATHFQTALFFSDKKHQSHSFITTGFLPTPGYYAFLFRYQLF